jgi:hypothetical protein
MYTIQVTFDQEEGRDIFARVIPRLGMNEDTTKALVAIIAEGMNSIRQEGTINIYQDGVSSPCYHVEVFHGKIEVTE